MTSQIKTTELLKSSLQKNEVLVTFDDYIKKFDLTTTTQEERLEEAKQLNQEFYALVTDFYLHGWGPLFHFGLRKKGERLEDSLVRHEFYMIDKLGLNEGEKCLDIGCGVAGPMMNIARKYKAKIVGINNSEYQLIKAKKFIEEAGLENSCSFIHGDWMNIPLPDASFEKAYTIEASLHAADRRIDLFKEIHRLLKSGGMFAGYEWVMKDKYDDKNIEHIAIKHAIESGNGITNLNYTKDVKEALIGAGFNILECRDMSNMCDPETPWFLPLKGEGISIRQIRKSPIGRFFMRRLITILEFIKVLPRGTLKVSRLLNFASEALVKGGEKDIFTPMLLFVAMKK
jgi:sterol 24-C-methyltransferase